MPTQEQHSHPVLEIGIGARCDAIYFLQETVSLGDTLVVVVKILQKFYHAVGRVHVSVKHDDSCIVLEIPGQHLVLEFEARTQRLKTIILQSVQKLVLTYRGAFFSSPQQALLPRLREIDATFGATKPGVIKDSLYILSYPGIDFHFGPLPKNSSKIHNDLVCSSIKITIEEPAASSIENCNTWLLSGRSNFALEKVQIYDNVPNRYSFHFQLLHQNTSSLARLALTRVVRLNDSCQNVQSELGAPDDVYFKSDQKMLALGAPAQAQPQTGTDFFYNYFKLGMDMLFDGCTKRLQKVVLHTCRPEHQEFGKRYSPCIFEYKESERKLSYTSTYADLLPFIGNVDEPIILTRQNTCNSMLDELTSITGANTSSGFVYHAATCSEIYEITANGKLAMLTIY